MDMKQRARELLRRLEAAIAANQLVLPSLPEVVIRVRALTESGNCSVEELEREISRDPAIAARLVKVANSSIMRRGVPVSSVRQAIVLLGFRLVRSMVTQLALLQTMGRAGGDPGRLRGFVEGGLHISALCRDLAESFPYLDAELAALGGLLHDIGKLPLREFLRQQPELSGIERLRFELMLHPLVGAMLLRHWDMPEELIQMARWHETVLRDNGRPLPDYVDVVIAANLMHYGTQKGRYARYAGVSVPALEKCLTGRNQDEPNLHVRRELVQLMTSE
ncbi:HDOD domain-containing protein [Halopseudomonas sp. Lyrl_26]|uniref:HDOD domain-containing protein n=1 Tax=Halopseudomonas sp. Lyrl_26 TaxID=3110923 RepID=UPI003F7F1BD8